MGRLQTGRYRDSVRRKPTLLCPGLMSGLRYCLLSVLSPTLLMELAWRCGVGNRIDAHFVY